MSTPSPYYPAEHRAARAVADTQAINETTSVLRQLAHADRHLDARRGEVSASLAALVEAVGRHYRSVPAEIATCAMGVVGAVDRATGNRR